MPGAGAGSIAGAGIGFIAAGGAAFRTAGSCAAPAPRRDRSTARGASSASSTRAFPRIGTTRAGASSSSRALDGDASAPPPPRFARACTALVRSRRVAGLLGGLGSGIRCGSQSSERAYDLEHFVHVPRHPHASPFAHEPAFRVEDEGGALDAAHLPAVQHLLAEHVEGPT